MSIYHATWEINFLPEDLSEITRGKMVEDKTEDWLLKGLSTQQNYTSCGDMFDGYPSFTVRSTMTHTCTVYC